jgi:hypothetical protein
VWCRATLTLGSSSPLSPQLCLPSFPTSLRFLCQPPLFLHLPLPLKVPKSISLSLSALCVCMFLSVGAISDFYRITTCFFCGTDGNSKSSKSVKLREDWRNRSKPIPPGGTYPAKDHCRFNPPTLLANFFLSFLFFPPLPFFFNEYIFYLKDYIYEKLCFD